MPPRAEGPAPGSLEEAVAKRRRGRRLLVPVPIDEAKFLSAGLRKLAGRYIVLYTDLPAGPEVDTLPQVFDAAVPQWAEYFGFSEDDYADWSMIGFVIDDKEKFRALGVLPESLPAFANGYSIGKVLWMYEQPSAYYRRHLLLHEGVHGFMRYFYGDDAPPWYEEGMAELLATHRYENGRLEVNYVPRSRDEAPMWGRVRILREAFAAGKALDWEDVLNLGPTAHREVDAYGWSWAACLLLEKDPRFHERFRRVPALLEYGDFFNGFHDLFADDWDTIRRQWRVMVAMFDYGYDVSKETVDGTPGQPLPAEGAEIVVSAEHGWQNSGYRLEVGKTYRITARGRYTIAVDPEPWPCEPNGVTVRYFKGFPLGILLAAVYDDETSPEGLWNPVPVGLEQTLVIQRPGTLFFRVNDSPAEWDDNQGELRVRVTPITQNGSSTTASRP